MNRRLTLMLQWLVVGPVVGAFCGSASALFLWLLDGATRFRSEHEQLIWALPVVGLAMGWVSERFGESVSSGTNLIIDTIHDDGPEVPLRMTPMVLAGTVLTHLFGGSAGREGTAVQMGASLTDWLSHRLEVTRDLRRQLLAAGVAGGFGSVFGTPVAGAVFGLEFVVFGHVEYEALVPAVIASVVGDQVTRALGIRHTEFPTVAELPMTWVLLAKWVVFAAAVAVVSVVFVEVTHWLKRAGRERIKRLPFRMFVGGVAVVALWQVFGTSDYLGLGVPVIVRAFHDPQFTEFAFAAKLLFTAVTLGAGFVGGEVTPLFFIGAALGNVLARLLDLPVEVGAGVGLAAMFASSANTPLALTVMAVELFGANVLPHAAVVCVVAYALTGPRGIYSAQRASAKVRT